MAYVQHAFRMNEPPEQAQARFGYELMRSIDWLGFRLSHQAPGLLMYNAKLDWWLALLLLPVALWPKLAGYGLSVSFVPDGSGTEVRVSGKASKSTSNAISVLGEAGRWPDGGVEPPK